MQKTEITLDRIEACLADRRKTMIFPPDIERLYTQNTASYRIHNFRQGILPALLIYNLFLVADYLLVPENLALAAFLHLAVVSPLILGALWLFPRLKNPSFRDMVAMAIPLGMVMQIMLIFLLSASETRGHYQYLAIPVIIYTNINLRSGYRTAALSTIVISAMYLMPLWLFAADFVVQFVGTCLVASAGYLSLMANKRMDYDMRRSYLMSQREMLQRKDAEHAAHFDMLTGVANRRALHKRVEEIWSEHDDAQARVAVIMFDIDHFKNFNDHYGHIVGDGCIQKVAHAIAAHGDGFGGLTVRQGGEEFLLLIKNMTALEARQIAEQARKIIEALGIPHAFNEGGSVVTVSAGVSAGLVNGHAFSEILESADAALYAAKQAGRNQVWPPIGAVLKPGDDRATIPKARTTRLSRPL